MFDRTYQPGGSFTPANMDDFEVARVQVFRPGFGWVDRPVEPEPEDVADECPGAA